MYVDTLSMQTCVHNYIYMYVHTLTHVLSVSDLHWISTFAFAVVYTPQSPAEAMPSHVFLEISVMPLINKHVRTYMCVYAVCDVHSSMSNSTT